MSWAATALGADGNDIVPAPADDAYRAAADIELRLIFQGTATGAISRALRLFGGPGRCEAWYEISEVINRPAGHAIAAGERLWLRYTCGRDRTFRSGAGGTVAWGRVGPRPYEAFVWLRAGDVERDRHGSWAVQNPHDWFAPLAVNHGEP